MPSLYLIDGHAQFFRAYHAIRTAMTSPVTKEPTNMTFGFVGMLLKVLREYKPDYLAVVIDAAGDTETFRSELYADYKANRAEAPEDLGPQIDRCLRILSDMHIPVLAEPGVEADDVIATIVRRLQRERPDLAIRIVSKDKDLTQLLNHNVELFDVHKDQAVTAADVFGVEGVKPEHVRDILALMGDAVDNVPGVPGIGPKTAAQLILQYGTVENLLTHLDEIKGKRRENIENARQILGLSKQLVTLREDLDVAFELELARSRPSTLPVGQLLGTMRELGFNRYQDELKALVGTSAAGAAEVQTSTASQTAALVGSQPPSSASRTSRKRAEPAAEGGLFAHLHTLAVESGTPPSSSAGNAKSAYECITSIERLDALIAEVRETGELAFDTETTGLSVTSAELCGVSISCIAGRGAYIPVRSPQPESHLDTATVVNRLRAILEDPSIRKIGHNLKFDLNVMRRHGVRVRGELWDTMIASYIIDATRSSHGLDVLALALLQHTSIPLTDLIGSGKKQRCFDAVSLDRATEYAAEDADIAMRLRDVIQPQLHAMGLTGLFADVEIPLAEVLAEMEWNGIRIDPQELDRQRSLLLNRIDALKRQIAEASPAHLPFNPDSPKQLAVVLFNRPDQDPPGLGLKVIKRGKTGPSTDVEVLEKLAGDPEIASELPRLIVEYRQLTKLVNTYLLALKDAIDPRSHRVHASFHQTVAATGRLSSADPNLQNIPIRTDIGREIRRAFIAEKSQDNWLNATSVMGATASDPRGASASAVPAVPADEPNVLITADYSQIELRLLAHLSEDPALIDAFESGLDIHRAVAAEVFGVRPEDVTPGHRNSAKMVNFGIVYGITAFGLARRLTMSGAETSKEQAGQIIAGYKARFSRIDAFLERCVQMARTHGYVETILKRRRAIPQVLARNPQEKALGERMAINTVVQGSAADLIKLAMIDIHRHLEIARRGGVTSSERSSTAGATARATAGGTASERSESAVPELASALACTRMILQIHDELVFETPRSCAEPVAAFVKQRMQNAMKLRVPLVVDAAWSENWIDAK